MCTLFYLNQKNLIVPDRFLKNMLVAWQKYKATCAWVLLLVLIALCYGPGLYGGFVFDDDANILQNASLKISDGSWQQFWSAAVSGHAGPLGRPIALFTFALNYYWAGTFDPFHFKLVNLFIHLLNAILIGYFSQQIFQIFVRNEKNTAHQGIFLVGWVVAALWALHPINLTAVLYVVQRMTSLCTLFGMAGLVAFVKYRSATHADVKLKHPMLLGALCCIFVICCLLLSVLTKESGVLFALLLIWTEWCVFQFRYGDSDIVVGKWRLRTIVAWSMALVIAYMSIFKVPAMVSSAAYANREFTLIERGLTEARVLVFYLRMLVLPVNSQLSLYHDDFEISKSLLSPASTLAAFAFLFIITAVAWVLRKRFSVLLFGWGWFIISHSLESTIFPLELVYEHRNYFATVGLLILVPALVRYVSLKNYNNLAVLLLMVYLALLGFITHVRSLQWSSNTEWAILEAENKPASMRANYELGRIYILLMNASGDVKFGQLADEALIRAAQNDPSSMLPLVARVQLAYLLNKTPSRDLIAQIKSGFRSEKYKNVNTSVLSSLVVCQINGFCHLSNGDILDILQSAFENPFNPRGEQAEVLKLMAQYHINRMNGVLRGIDLIRQSIEIRDQVASRIMYSQALALSGRFDEAMSELQTAELMDRRREYSQMIIKERKNIKEAREKP